MPAPWKLPAPQIGRHSAFTPGRFDHGEPAGEQQKVGGWRDHPAILLPPDFLLLSILRLLWMVNQRLRRLIDSLRRVIRARLIVQALLFLGLVLARTVPAIRRARICSRSVTEIFPKDWRQSYSRKETLGGWRMCPAKEE